MRTWGWHIAEHLTMAAHVLPRVVKVLLAGDGCYTMTLDDRVSSLAVDPLLSSTQWVHDDEIEKVKSWQDIMASTRFRTQIDEATEAFMLKHPDAFKDAPEK